MMGRGGAIGSPRQRTVARRTAVAPIAELDYDTTLALLQLAEKEQWPEVCAGLRASGARSASAIALRDTVLDAIASGLTPSYHQRWSAMMGEFVAALNLGPADQPAEQTLGTRVGERDLHEVAIDLARQHLAWSAERNHTWSTNFVREHCSTGYRNTYLSQLRRLGEQDQLDLLNRICQPLPAWQTLTFDQQIESAERLNWSIWMQCWWQWKRSRKTSERPSAAELLLAIINDR
jgi:hypothetical protein